MIEIGDVNHFTARSDRVYGLDIIRIIAVRDSGDEVTVRYAHAHSTLEAIQAVVEYWCNRPSYRGMIGLTNKDSFWG